MKITISYLPAEAPTADAIVRILRAMLPGAKVRRSAAHPPQSCVYVTCNLSEKLCNTTKTT